MSGSIDSATMDVQKDASVLRVQWGSAKVEITHVQQKTSLASDLDKVETIEKGMVEAHSKTQESSTCDMDRWQDWHQGYSPGESSYYTWSDQKQYFDQQGVKYADWSSVGPPSYFELPTGMSVMLAVGPPGSTNSSSSTSFRNLNSKLKGPTDFFCKKGPKC